MLLHDSKTKMPEKVKMVIRNKFIFFISLRIGYSNVIDMKNGNIIRKNNHPIPEARISAI